MNKKNENFSATISDLNVESNHSLIRVIDDNEIGFVTGGATLIGSTYTQTQIARQSFSPALSWIPTQ